MNRLSELKYRRTKCLTRVWMILALAPLAVLLYYQHMITVLAAPLHGMIPRQVLLDTITYFHPLWIVLYMYFVILFGALLVDKIFPSTRYLGEEMKVEEKAIEQAGKNAEGVAF